MEVHSSPGATYRFAASDEARVRGAISELVKACLGVASGSHGTAHVRAAIAQNGAVRDVVVSPGGALSTRVAQCLTERLSGQSLPAPQEQADALLLFMVSSCRLD